MLIIMQFVSIALCASFMLHQPPHSLSQPELDSSVRPPLCVLKEDVVCFTDLPTPTTTASCAILALSRSFPNRQRHLLP
ncbi:hypothetical protein BDQ94DRAFT_86366 [Aspergillus welwitschiae]|uniref:Secreted protein n=1 Tax=Aspergillus welwitschiae TaxID=1341132 RepID=A0A3F3PQP0_9EURO|nr:hypothetical protein BDQ94DRAFT_86366 [Aspergillus welwitschiae]RDH29224.1 hypothetical protein BDQ94DRAFT_86366 [Aspergillus welwitschiae]